MRGGHGDFFYHETSIGVPEKPILGNPASRPTQLARTQDGVLDVHVQQEPLGVRRCILLVHAASRATGLSERGRAVAGPRRGPKYERLDPGPVVRRASTGKDWPFEDILTDPGGMTPYLERLKDVLWVRFLTWFRAVENGTLRWRSRDRGRYRQRRLSRVALLRFQ